MVLAIVCQIHTCLLFVHTEPLAYSRYFRMASQPKVFRNRNITGKSSCKCLKLGKETSRRKMNGLNSLY